jgi:cyclophilin family peptidyl-prolyl cis-trans isomerase/HEAT repeat protein
MPGRILIIITLLTTLACSVRQKPPNHFQDEQRKQIADYQDKRDVEGLLLFLSHKDDTYRASAALALGSVQDTTTQHALGKLLIDDTSDEVRQATAFTLGQLGTTVAFRYLMQARSSNRFDLLDEAIGKTAPDGDQAPDDLSSWGLYRLALRGKVTDKQVLRAAAYLNASLQDNVRLGAAHFFSRCPVSIQAAADELIRSVVEDSSVYVRMASAAALRKINSPNVRDAIVTHFDREPDYRVRVNLVRSLQPYALTDVSGTFHKAIRDQNINVGIAASEVLKQSGKDSYPFLVTWARDAKQWRVQANLYEAALAAMNNKELTEEVVRICEEEKDPYAKAAYISALGNSPIQYAYVQQQLFSSEVPVIRTTAISTLVRMNHHPDFSQNMQRIFLTIYQQAVQSNDAAVIGLAAGALGDSTLGYKRVITDLSFLYNARQRLDLPQDIEAIHPLETSIAYLEGKPAPLPAQNEFNHPIDWSLVKTITADQIARIHTSKGIITMRLLVEEAPGSVANFVHLSCSGYFNGKYFHRVVPNFVIQGGCNRGDGWGSEDYSIRSEFAARHYREGSVGMASAGKDTEGTQWFITHSPTPHLDARYSIFAEVIQGMEAVHAIEVGDRILSVEIE